MNSGRLCGQAIIAYLKRKGFAEVALHFVSDEKTRFDLAVESGNIDVALKSAQALDDQQCWQQLAMEALKLGKIEVVENSYIKTESWERLSFLYMLTGNHEKLSKMLRHAKEKRGSMMSRYHNALLLGDVEERVDVLLSARQPAMAYLHARSHGLNSQADEIADQLGEQVVAKLHKYMATKQRKLLVPPNPINRQTADNVNWPTLNVGKGFFDTDQAAAAPGGQFGMQEDAALDDLEAEGGWGDEMGLDDDASDNAGDGLDVDLDDDGEGGWDLGDVDVDLEGLPTPKHSDLAGFFTPPPRGKSVQQGWSQHSNAIADQVAAGSFDIAKNQLAADLGIVELAPLKSSFMSISLGAFSAMSAGSPLPPRMNGLNRWNLETRKCTQLPNVCITLESLSKQMQAGYDLFTKGKFSETKEAFLTVLRKIPFVVCTTKPQLNDLRKLLAICREYVLAMCVELHRREEAKSQPVSSRVCELAAYFTHFNIEPKHLVLALRQAMLLNFKAKNLVSASSFAKRLLELNPSPKFTQEATKVHQASAKAESNALQMDYDDRNPFTVCAGSLKPIYRGNPSVSCGFCGSEYMPEYESSICSVCGIAQVGAKVPGLSIMTECGQVGASQGL
jgi:coatomer protein complex subunit alpha (xenin)